MDAGKRPESRTEAWAGLSIPMVPLFIGGIMKILMGEDVNFSVGTPCVGFCCFTGGNKIKRCIAAMLPSNWKFMSKPTVDFYFDFGSPYSYIASCLIEKVCEKNGAELRWQPLVIGGLFKSNNTTPPFTLPNRARYMMADLEDLTKFFGIPYQQRTNFLFNPILALRATLAASRGEERGKAVHALFHGAWAKDLDLGDQEVALGLLNDAGLKGAALIERTKDDTIKSELRGNTDRADGLGIFGAPFSVVNEGEKMFWGHDRLELLGHYLASILIPGIAGVLEEIPVNRHT